jgi:hypothetical protein
MSQNIDNAFISQFETEVKLAYQRMGSKLTNTVRTKTNVKGKDTTFQKVGKGTAGQKSRHGLVPLMNLDHQPVKVTLADYYAGDYVDALDELKTNIDERNVVSQSGAAAMGRKSDEILNTVLAGATTVNARIAAGGTGLTQAKVNTVFENFGATDIPDDGERYFVVDPRCWTDLLGITAFSSSDYIGTEDLPYKGGMVAKRWLSFTFFTFSGLSNGAGGATEAANLAYHKTAAGFASGQEIKSTWSWENDRQANLCVYAMSQGAVEIDGIGIQVVDAVK